MSWAGGVSTSFISHETRCGKPPLQQRFVPVGAVIVTVGALFWKAVKDHVTDGIRLSPGLLVSLAPVPIVTLYVWPCWNGAEWVTVTCVLDHVYPRMPAPGLRLNADATEGWSISSENVTRMFWFTGTPVAPGPGLRAVTVGFVLSIVKSLSEASQPKRFVVSRAQTRTLAVGVSIVGIGFQLSAAGAGKPVVGPRIRFP